MKYKVVLMIVVIVVKNKLNTVVLYIRDYQLISENVPFVPFFIPIILLTVAKDVIPENMTGCVKNLITLNIFFHYRDPLLYTIKLSNTCQLPLMY